MILSILKCQSGQTLILRDQIIASGYFCICPVELRERRVPRKRAVAKYEIALLPGYLFVKQNESAEISGKNRKIRPLMFGLSLATVLEEQLLLVKSNDLGLIVGRQVKVKEQSLEGKVFSIMRRSKQEAVVEGADGLKLIVPLFMLEAA